MSRFGGAIETIEYGMYAEAVGSFRDANVLHLHVRTDFSEVDEALAIESAGMTIPARRFEQTDFEADLAPGETGFLLGASKLGKHKPKLGPFGGGAPFVQCILLVTPELDAPQSANRIPRSIKR